LKLPFGWQRVRLALAFAGASVRSNSRRIMLSVLGVAIGIAAVTSMLAIGHSLAAQADRTLARLGGDIVALSMIDAGAAPNGGSAAPAPATAMPSVDHIEEVISRAEALLLTMPEVQASTRVTRLPSCASGAEDPASSLDVIAATPELQQVLALTVSRGRFLHRLDGAQGWVVLGAEAAQELAAKAFPQQPGATLDLCGKQLRIAGVLARYDGDELLPLFKVNRALIVTRAVGDRLASFGTPAQLLVRLRNTDGDFVGALSQRLTAALGEPVTAQGARQFSQMRQEQTSLYMRFLSVLGGVALLVGSLGITNVMLVSVAERRAEIGLRAAIGARASDIAMQFMAESVMVCLCGALLGLLIGLLGTAITLSLVQIDFSLDWETPLAAVALALLSGLVAGAYPALRAAQLDPVVTLQGG
jgi:putative ABC transport system permease protein